MTIQMALLWGVGGTFIVQVFLFVRALERCQQWPWKSSGEAPFWIWVMTSILYAAISAFVVCLLYSMKQVNTPWAAFITGLGSDRVIENALKQVKAPTRKPRKGNTA